MAAFAEGLAPQNAPDSKRDALEYTMGFYCLDRILGTRWIEAAVLAEQGRNKALVKPYAPDKEATHAVLPLWKAVARVPAHSPRNW